MTFLRARRKRISFNYSCIGHEFYRLDILTKSNFEIAQHDKQEDFDITLYLWGEYR